MTTSKPTRDAIEAAAEAHQKENYGDSKEYSRGSFKAGANFGIAHERNRLAGLAGEFSSDNAKAMIADMLAASGASTDILMYVAVKHQHERTALPLLAKIENLQSDIIERIHREFDLRQTWREALAEVERLKAELEKR